MYKSRFAKSNDISILWAADDAGWSQPVFRIFMRIFRRTNSERGCFESIRSMAKQCRMNKDTAYKAIRFLKDHRVVVKQGDDLWVLHPNYWLAPDQHKPKETPPEPRDEEPVMSPEKGHGIRNEGYDVSEDRVPKTTQEVNTPSTLFTPPTPVEIHKQLYPNLELTKAQKEEICTLVKDLEVWRSTLKKWSLNYPGLGHQVANQLDRYEKDVRYKENQRGNKRSRRKSKPKPQESTPSPYASVTLKAPQGVLPFKF